MKVAFNLGSEVDLVSGDELRATAKDMQDSIISKLPRSMRLPIRMTAIGAAVTPASGPTVITIGPQGPALGRIWAITHVVIVGADDRTVVAGATAACYRGEPPGAAGQVADLSGLIFPAIAANTVPLEKAYSNSTLWVRGGEAVFAMVYGAAAGSSMQMMVEVMDYPDTAMEAGQI